MDPDVARTLLGASLVLTQAILIVPILVRVVRVRSADGISVVGECLWVAAGAGWAAYGLQTASVTLVVSGAIAAAGGVALGALLWPHIPRRDRRSGVAAALGAGAVFAGAALAGTAPLAGALAIFGIVQFLPQFARTHMSVRRGAAHTAVSASGAVLRSIYTAGWAVYAGAWFWWGIPLSDVDVPLLAWGLAGAVTFLYQAAAVAYIRPASRPARRRAA